MLDASLIAQVPHLIYSIKESGLILAVFGGSDEDKALGKIIARGCCGKGAPSIEGLPSVDACMSNGYVCELARELECPLDADPSLIIPRPPVSSHTASELESTLQLYHLRRIDPCHAPVCRIMHLLRRSPPAG